MSFKSVNFYNNFKKEMDRMIDIDLGGCGVLYCPLCGNDYLHPISVQAQMKFEDIADTAVYEISHTGVATSPAGFDTGNDAGRRECIQIAFNCEGVDCDLSDYRLMIMQHKGPTSITWIRKKK